MAQKTGKESNAAISLVDCMVDLPVDLWKNTLILDSQMPYAKKNYKGGAPTQHQL